MDDWVRTVSYIYQVLQMTAQAVKVLRKIRKAISNEYAVEEIKENIESGELHFGDKITVLGTFSEYLPFIDPKFILKNKEILLPRTFPRTARMEAIEDTYCGALFPLDRVDAFSKEVLPVFYGPDSRMLEHYTGQMLEIEGKLVEIPMAYRNIINKNEYFTLEKEKGLVIPFGLKVSKVEPYGLVDSFTVNSWLVGSMNPAPHFKVRARSTKDCRLCTNFFSYMAIDPVQWPLKYGCFAYTPSKSDIPKSLKKHSAEFVELDRKLTPYVIFPRPYSLFEVFCPAVDILNDDQRKHSNDLLLGAVERNMEILFQHGPFLEGLEIPKESTVSIDFQYDQQNKITQQTFNPANVPEWKCPNFVSDPKWREKLAKSGKTEEEISRERFKLRKSF